MKVDKYMFIINEFRKTYLVPISKF